MLRLHVGRRLLKHMPNHRNHRKPKRNHLNHRPLHDEEQAGEEPAGEQSHQDLDELLDELNDEFAGSDEQLKEKLQEIADLLGNDFEIFDVANELGDLAPEIEIVSEEDDEDPDWENGHFSKGYKHDAPPLDDVLQQLVAGESLPPLPDLYALSDLTIEEAERIRRDWDQIQPARRKALLEYLIAQTEETLDLQLGRLLRIALHDPEPAIREQALRGLWEDDDVDLLGPLIQLLQHDENTQVRAAAATALGSFVLAGELDALDAALAIRVEEALLAILHDEEEPLEVRRRALESVAYSGEIGVRQVIEDAYYAPEDEMRISALFAMGRSADVRWRGFARAELQNPDVMVRAEAAVACGELEARNALEDLLSLLGDDEARVRLAAIFALGRIGGDEAHDALQAVVLGSGEEEAAAAEEALEELQFYADMNATPLFDEALDDEDEWDNDPLDFGADFDDRDLGQYE